MSTIEITTKIEALKELEALIEEAKAEAETLRDEIKAEMTAQGVDEMAVSCFKVRYKEVKTSRFDSTAFKKTHADLYEQYTRQTTSKRFTIA